MHKLNAGATITSLDRTEMARALATAIAQKRSGKDHEAQESARKLVILLERAEILK